MYEHTQRDTIGPRRRGHHRRGLASRRCASTTRPRATATAARSIVEFTPVSTVGVNFSLAYRQGRLRRAPTRPRSSACSNNKNTAFTVGVSYAPNAKVNVGADYGRETFDALQQSRNANPAPDPTWTDPNRNWTMANDETVNTFSLYLNLIKLHRRRPTSASATTTATRTRRSSHGGPRIALADDGARAVRRASRT